MKWIYIRRNEGKIYKNCFQIELLTIFKIISLHTFVLFLIIKLLFCSTVVSTILFPSNPRHRHALTSWHRISKGGWMSMFLRVREKERERYRERWREREREVMGLSSRLIFPSSLRTGRQRKVWAWGLNCSDVRDRDSQTYTQIHHCNIC